MGFHRFPEEFHSCLAITALCDKAFQDFLFSIDIPPEVVRLAVDPLEYLIQMPLLVSHRPHSINPFPADLSDKY